MPLTFRSRVVSDRLESKNIDMMYTEAMIIKPEIDHREYQHHRLENGLEMVIISDPDTNMAAGSLSVNVGNYQDPDVHGLAHFLEHMLFMGTKTYPDENLYQKILSDNNGMSNAWTGGEHTNYHFCIDPHALDKIIDVFAHFFIDPLLKKDAVEREMNAVDSEHQKNLTNDTWREFQVGKQLINPDHPYTKFGTGNLDTLNIPEIHDQLLKFYNRYYHAERMRLVLLGSQPIEQLVDTAKQIFSRVPTGAIKHDPLPRLSFNNHHLVWKPIKDSSQLSIIWCLPPVYSHYRIQPISYISHLLGHETEGSIYRQLFGEGLIYSLSCYTDHSDSTGCMVTLEVQLTDQGFHAIHHIIHVVVEYINRHLKYNTDLYRELHIEAENHFRFMGKRPAMAYVTELAQNLHLYPPEHVISAPYLLDKPSNRTQKLVEKYINLFRTVPYATMLSSPQVKAKDYTQTEQWYKIKYAIAQQIKPIKLPDSALNLHLPGKNPFIVSHVKIGTDPDTDKPVRLPQSQVWLMRTVKFSQPTIYMEIAWESDRFNESVITETGCIILTQLIEENFKDSVYYAQRAGATIDISYGDGQFVCTVECYPSQLVTILKTIFEQVQNPEMTHFELKRQHLTKNLYNLRYGMTVQQANDFIESVILKHHYRNEQLHDVCQTIQEDELFPLVKYWSSYSRYTMFIIGDCSIGLGKKVHQLLDDYGYTPQYDQHPRRDIRTEFPTHHMEPSLNLDDNNQVSVVMLPLGYIRYGASVGWKENILGVHMVDILFNEPFFDQLRTKEQLGYVVRGGFRSKGDPKNPFFYYSMTIQSAKKPSQYLTKRSVKFIDDMRTKIQNITVERYNQVKQAVHQQLIKKDTSLQHQIARYRTAVMTGTHIYNYEEILLRRLKSYDINQFKLFVRRLLIDYWSYEITK